MEAGKLTNRSAVKRRSLRHLLEGLFGLRGSGRFQKRLKRS